MHQEVCLRVHSSLSAWHLLIPATEGEDSNGVSRASSVSAKASNLGAKRKNGKQRREDSESWDSRSNYIAWGTTQNATWAPMPPTNQQFYPVPNAQFNGQFQQVYGNGVQPGFGSNQPYAQGMANSSFVPQYNAMSTVSLSSFLARGPADVAYTPISSMHLSPCRNPHRSNNSAIRLPTRL